MTDTETPKTSDTIIASAQADTTPGALSDASVTDKPGDGGVLFDADGNPISPTPNPFAGLVPLKVEGEPVMWNNREAMPDPDSAVPYTYNGQQMWIEGRSDDLVYRTPEQRAAFDKFNADAVASLPSSTFTFPADVPISKPGETVDTRDTKIAELETDVDALKADLLYLRSLHGWPVEEGNKLKAYYHAGLKKLGIGE